jgi:hypothetical protein
MEGLPAWGSVSGLSVGLFIGPGPNYREFAALAIQRADYTPEPYEENEQPEQPNQTE